MSVQSTDPRPSHLAGAAAEAGPPRDLLQNTLHDLLGALLNSTHIGAVDLLRPMSRMRFRVDRQLAALREAADAFPGAEADALRRVVPARAPRPAELAEVVAAGYRLLAALTPATERVFVAPGADARWLGALRTAPEMRPVRRLARLLGAEGREAGVAGAWLHGSFATLDYVAGYSDLDALVLLDAAACRDAPALLRARRLLTRAAVELRALDALQHHGFFVVSELDLPVYCEPYLPLEVWRHAQRLDAEAALPLRLAARDATRECAEAFSALVRDVERLASGPHPPSSAFDVKTFVQTALMLPLLALQLAEGRYRYKRDALPAARAALAEAVGEVEAREAWRLVEAATRMRAGWRYHRILPAPALRGGAALFGSPRLWESAERVLSRAGGASAARAAGPGYREAALRLASACRALVSRSGGGR